jgi:hypothetical protein
MVASCMGFSLEWSELRFDAGGDKWGGVFAGPQHRRGAELIASGATNKVPAEVDRPLDEPSLLLSMPPPPRAVNTAAQTTAVRTPMA